MQMLNKARGEYEALYQYPMENAGTYQFAERATEVNTFLCTNLLPSHTTAPDENLRFDAWDTYTLAQNYCNGNYDRDGTCKAVVFGCVDVDAFNYDSIATVDDGNCRTGVPGCMDSTSRSYKAEYTVHTPLTCTYDVYGCGNRSEEHTSELQSP